MKVNVGRGTGKKYPHPLSKNVYTTASYGFVQPSLCRECAAQDTLDLRVASKVYLQPLVKPTFGRMFLKQYHVFVPTADIYHPYESFLAGKPYNGSGNAHYIPSDVPKTSLAFLTLCMYMMSDVYFFSCSDVYTAQNIGNIDRGKVLHIETPVEDSNSLDKATLLAFFQEIATNAGISLPSTFFDCAYSLAVTSFNGATQPYGDGNINFNMHVDQDDFNPDYFDWIIPTEISLDDQQKAKSFTGVFCGRLTDRGRNFRKILIGLGYQPVLSSFEVTALPLFAYYKTWFDLFAIQRDMTWKDTNAFTVMEYIEQNNSSIYNIAASVTRQNIALAEFLFQDLPTCYYTQSADYAGAHISGTAITNPQTPLSNSLPGGNSGYSSVETEENNQPYIYTDSGLITQNQLDILKKLYQRVNITTAIGGKIAEFMRAVFGSDYKQECESNFIGAQTTNIDISEVMSTAETSEGYLGEYAGKGIASDVGNNHKFTARVAGFLISVFTIVPDSRLCQAVDPNLFHTKRYDFFDPSFDAITLIPSPKLAVFGNVDVYPDQSANALNDGFGNIPNYTEYKVMFDTLNGDMSLRSTRANMLPFSLGKYITPDIVRSYNDDEFDFICPNDSIFSAGDIWRYIGLYRWLGNFDRTFINEGRKGVSTSTRYLDSVADRLEDNFSVYQYCDLKVQSFALPLADSWQTDSFGDHIKVEKA